MSTRTLPRSFQIHAHRRLARSELEDVRAYARLATELMVRQAQEHDAHVDAAVSSLSEEEREAYFENNSDTYELLVRRFPNQQQQSLIVLAYSVVESRLIAVAQTLMRQSSTGLNLKDLSGDSPFQKARKVVSKVARFAIEQRLWDSVEAYRQIRNAIVHTAGDLGPSPPQLVEQLLTRRSSEIRRSSTEGLVIEPTFVFGLLDASEELSEAVFQAWLAADAPNAA